VGVKTKPVNPNDREPLSKAPILRKRASTFDLTKLRSIEAYAILVDINGFTMTVERSHQDPNSIAQYVRDVLTGPIAAIEESGGEVLGFMGDALFGIVPNDVDTLFITCSSIAREVDRSCEYLSNVQANHSDAWTYAPGGPSLKISAELGWMDVSTIASRALGHQPILIGTAINYAARISKPGKGNRCHLGRLAGEQMAKYYRVDGPYSVDGKEGEPEYSYYRLGLGDVWREGELEEGDETYWG
jgi:class 3 adenylate cyclase